MAHGKNAEWAGRFCDFIGGKKLGLAEGLCDKSKRNRKKMHKAARRKAEQEVQEQLAELQAMREEKKLVEEVREFAELVAALNEPW